MTESSNSGKASHAQKPHATTDTTPPKDTYYKVETQPGEGMLMYWPEQNGFLALFPEEYREFYAEADEHSKKIAALQNANQNVTEMAIALRNAHIAGVVADIDKAEADLQKAISDMSAASDDVKKKLEGLSKLDAKAGVKLIELVSLKTRKYKDKAVPIYVRSTTIKKYCMIIGSICLMVRRKRKSKPKKV